MLNKLLNQKVVVGISSYAYSVPSSKGFGAFTTKVGCITDVDDNFIEIDNKTIIAIKTITYIEIV